MNIAIDGPAGAGKSTIAKKLAKEMGFIYVDTGAMYRAMALFFLKQNLSSSDENKITAAAKDIDISICYQNKEQQVLLNGENVTGEIRSEAVGNMASAVSIYPAVRQKLTSLQQNLAANANVIMDGRDIGTCVLPNAEVKIYLTASVLARAKRRYDELQEKGIECTLEAIQKDIEERDYRDMHREISPLKQAKDAVFLDSSDLTIAETAKAIQKICQERM